MQLSAITVKLIEDYIDRIAKLTDTANPPDPKTAAAYRYVGRILRVMLDPLDASLRDSLKHLDRDPLVLDVILSMPKPEPDGNKDVHTEHCCFNCGCKYGYADKDQDGVRCPVLDKIKRQSFRCNFDCCF